MSYREQSWDGNDWKAAVVTDKVLSVNESVKEVVVSCEGKEFTVKPWDVKLSVIRQRSRSRERPYTEKVSSATYHR